MNYEQKSSRTIEYGDPDLKSLREMVESRWADGSIISFEYLGQSGGMHRFQVKLAEPVRYISFSGVVAP